MVPTEAEIQDAFTRAPRDIQQYVDSPVVFDAFHAIRTTHKLHLDHAANLSRAIDAVVLGLRPFEELPKLLTEALPGVDTATQAQIVTDINEKIFKPLREQTRQKAEAVQKQKVSDSSAQAKQLASLKERLAEHAGLRSAQEHSEPEKPAPQGPVLVSEPTGSVIFQKLTPIAPPVSAPSAPEVAHPVETVATQPAPQSKPATYHGSDPYRESTE